MPNSTSDHSPREAQFNAIIAKYLLAADQGQPPNQAQFISLHPEFAVELREFFADMGRIVEVARPYRSDDSGTVAAVGLKIRDYLILEEIGTGGMGTVYLALHMQLEKTVALKILKADRGRNPQAIARFKREMKAVGMLEHQHIVRALDAGDEAGTHFLAMEYIEGCDLGRLLQTNGRMEVPLACELIRQAALGLQHAHDHQLVHRDVKPSNLILSKSTKQVKVLDLGLAQLQVNADHSHELTGEGQLVGTWLYMAPEQFRPGCQVDSRSDIFSLGVTFYSFLVGTLPLNRGQAATYLPAIGTQRPDVPPDVQTLLTKMLVPDQDQRIQSMSEVARVLEPYAKQGFVNMIASSADRRSGAKEMPASPADTRSGSSTADVPKTIQPPILVSPPETDARDLSQFQLDDGAPIPSRRPWPHLVAAAGGVIVLLMMLAGGAMYLGWPDNPRSPTPQPPPPPPPGYATIDVTNEEPDDKGDDWAIARRFVEEIVAEKKLYLINRDTKARIYLVLGNKNHIPPGTYELKSDDPDLQLPALDSELQLSEGFTLPLPLRLLPPTIYARLPDCPGAICSYKGTLQHAGLPPPKEGQTGVAYDLTLRTHDEVMVDGKPWRWLEAKVMIDGDEGKYTETAWLLVDAKRYQVENKLYVHRGWVVAESASVSKWLKYLFPDQDVERLEANFNIKPGGDSLQTLAKRLSIPLPRDRIAVNDALVLFFDAQIHAPYVARARSALATGKRVSSRKRVNVTAGLLRGTHRGWTISPGSPLYNIEGADKVPFLFADITITAPEVLTASCRLVAAGGGGVVPPPPFASLEANSQILEELRSLPEPFDVARIPTRPNVQAAFTGTIQLEEGPVLKFSTSVRTVAFPDALTCWLEIDVKSGLKGTESQEKAWILVPKEWNKDDGLQIRKGWLLVEGEMLPFDIEGNETYVEETLFKLDKSLKPFRLSVQQVLSLLFNAQLERAGDLTRIRKNVDAAIKASGEKRVHSLEDFPGNLGDEVTCEAWSFSKAEKLDFKYEIVRSNLLDFDFYSVLFESPQLTIDTKRNWLTAVPAALPFDTGAMKALEDETSKRIDDLAKDADKKNLRIWRGKDGKILFWGEFAAEKRVSNIVVLKFANGKPPKLFQPTELSELDRAWIKQGRHWRSKAELPFWKENEGRARNTGFSSKKTEIIFDEKVDEDKSIPIEKFSDYDQKWVEEYIKYRE